MHLSLYLPRVVLGWPDPDLAYQEIDGTLVFCDISGFTALSERLAEKGKVGSEEVTQVLNGAFTELLDVAALDGGDLLKFGGDALLHLYMGEEHEGRAARAAFDMRDALDEYQEGRSPVPLSMSVGIASGPVQLFLAGTASRELVIAGPTATLLTQMEGTADSDEILLAPSTAEALDDDVLGDAKGDGVLLDDAPDADEWDDDGAPGGEGVDFGQFISARLRKHLTLAFNEGEHRHANVAFVKVAGFDGYLEDNGTDAAAEALHLTVSGAQQAAERFGVTFLQSDISADGAKMILTTGVPERGDAEEERILRASQAIATLDTPFHLQVGVASGGVFAGDLGARTRRVYTVMGDTVNLAARLAFAGEPGQTLVTERLVTSSGFAATQLEPIALKGKSQPVAPFLLGEVGGDIGETTTEDDLPLTGRDAEKARLEELLSTALTGGGAIVDIVAPAGGGKTRLLRELRHAAGDIDIAVAVGEPYESNTAYFVFGQLLRPKLGIDQAMEPTAAGELLADLVSARLSDLQPWLPLLAQVVGANVPTTPEVDALDDRYAATKTGEVVAALLSELLGGPALLMIDGGQWIDDASRSLLDHLVPTITDRPWLVAIARRPEPGWEEFAGDTEVTLQLEPIDHDAAAHLAAAALGDAAVPAPVFDAIVSRSGGNPFFLLQLVRAAREGSGDLPTNVETAVAGRIDHLQLKDRRLLGYAAVLGQQFSLDLLADALGDTAVVEDMDAWERLGDFLETSVAGKVRFRQPIVRDVAYERLPFARRRELHVAVGKALERRARKRPERFAELLAVHFDRAGEYDRSWRYSVMAAERARKKYATVDATDLYKQALAAADKMEEEVAADELAAVAEALGDVAEVAGLYDDAETGYLNALEIVGDDAAAAGRLLLKRGTVQERKADYDAAMKLLDEASTVLGSAGSDAEEIRLEVLVEKAGILSRQGDMEGAIEICDQVIAEADPEAHPRVVAHAYYLIEFAYTRLNHPERGTVGEKAAEIYRELGDLVRLGNVLNNLGYDAFYLGRWDDAERYWTEAKEVRDKAGDIVGSALQENNLGEMAVNRGRFEEGKRLLEHALRVWRGAGYQLGVGYVQANLGMLYARTGEMERARRHLDASVDVFTSAGAEAYLPDAHMRYAEFLLLSGDAEGAAAMVTTDIDAAEADTLALSTLHRLRGIARLMLGDGDAGRADLDKSLELATEADAHYDEALARDAIAALDGTEDPASVELLDRLGVDRETLARRVLATSADTD